MKIYFRSAAYNPALARPKPLSLISGIGASTYRSQPFQHPLKFYLHRARATDDEAARLAASPPDRHSVPG